MPTTPKQDWQSNYRHRLLLATVLVNSCHNKKNTLDIREQVEENLEALGITWEEFIWTPPAILISKSAPKYVRAIKRIIQDEVG